MSRRSDSEEEFYDAKEDKIDQEITWAELMKNLDEELEKAKTYKEDGNKHFQHGEFELAENSYLQALDGLPNQNQISGYGKDIKPEDEPAAYDRAVLHGNLSAVQFKNQRLKEAIENATESLRLKSDYLKVRIRRAKMYEEDDKPHESLEDWKQVLILDTNNREAQTADKRLAPKIEEKNERLKKEMFDGMKKLGNFCLKPFGLSTDNFKVEQNEGGSYNIQFQQ